MGLGDVFVSLKAYITLIYYSSFHFLFHYAYITLIYLGLGNSTLGRGRKGSGLEHGL